MGFDWFRAYQHKSGGGAIECFVFFFAKKHTRQNWQTESRRMKEDSALHLMVQSVHEEPFFFNLSAEDKKLSPSMWRKDSTRNHSSDTLRLLEEAGQET